MSGAANAGRVAVLHVFPEDLARGAQNRARALRLELDSPEDPHRTLAIFHTKNSAGLADLHLGVARRRIDRIVSLAAVRRLREFNHSAHSAVVVAYGSEALRYVALARLRDQHIVYSKIGMAASHLTGGRLAFHRYLSSRADVIAAVSSATAQEAVDLLGMDPSRVVLVSNGRDPKVYRPDAARSVRSGPVRVLWVGEMVEGKRPELFVELIRSARASGSNIEGLMVGAGALSAGIAQAAAPAGIKLLGQRGDVPELMRNADLLVFTSRGDGEGMPGVLIEAGLSGLPVVASNVPGASDVVLHDQTGFLVDIDDVSGMCRALTRLCHHKGLRDEMGNLARKHCVEQLSIGASADRWRTLLAGLSGRRSAP